MLPVGVVVLGEVAEVFRERQSCTDLG
jgi:hypothetical protein